jgi:hypothetical protein
MPTCIPGQSRLNFGLPHHVRSTLDSDRIADIPERQFRANKRSRLFVFDGKFGPVGGDHSGKPASRSAAII